MSASEKLLSLLLLLLLVKDASVEGLTSLSILCKDADTMLGGGRQAMQDNANTRCVMQLLMGNAFDVRYARNSAGWNPSAHPAATNWSHHQLTAPSLLT